MSRNNVFLAENIIRDHFGEVVAKVASLLVRDGWSSLPLIGMKLQLPVIKLKQSLLVLLQHNIATYTVTDKGLVEFHCDLDSILRLNRFPWYLHATKSLYGSIAELIFEEVLANGQLTLSQCVRRVLKLAETLGLCKAAEEVKQNFAILAEAQFLIRCPKLDGETEAPNMLSVVPIFNSYKDPFQLPESVNITELSRESMEEVKSKKRKFGESAQNKEPDAEILWRVNFEKFHRHLRDQLILEMVHNNICEKSVEVFRAFLRLSELRSDPSATFSQPLSFIEATKMISESTNLVPVQMQQYASLLSDEKSQFFRKVGESAGGLYVIDFSNATKALAQCCIEDVVREKFGSKALRIFRLLLIKQYLEQTELENMVMMPSKEGKDITYRLLTDGYISLKEVPKTSDFAPSRTFYLFYVNLPQVARNLLEVSYKTAYNLVLRRVHEVDQHKALLERQERLDAVVANIQKDENMDDETKARHIADVEETYVSHAEKLTLAKHRQTVSRLQQAEIEIDRSIFILQSYLKYVAVTIQSSKRDKK